MGRIFRQDGPFLLNLISALGGMTVGWSAAFAVYLLIMLLMLVLKPENREDFPVQRRWKLAAATVTVSAVGIAVQRSAKNAIRWRNIRTLSGPIQPASQPPSLPTVGIWPRVRKSLIGFCLWLVSVSVLLGLIAWAWVVGLAIGGLMKLGWPWIATAFLLASVAIVWMVVIRRRLMTSKQPLWAEPEPQEPQSAPIERADEPAETGDVLRYHSKLQDESAGGNLDMPIGLGLTMCGLLMLSTAWTAITVNRFNLTYRLIVAAISVGLAALLAKAAWGRFKLGFMWLDRERVKAEKLAAQKKLEKERLRRS
jgi:hypothetical protein